MRLEPGASVGSYEIVAPIGRGGMGEVYRARDSRLRREVALKVLPRAFENDPERLARFEREAQLLAALNHPNIAAIYGVEETEGVTALVLELVEGLTLADRIAVGGLPVAESLAIAAQIADALDAAHERGVIHRDLKPANVKIRTDGSVKVLDFGLAKAFEPGAMTANAEDSPTLTAAATRTGVILGTAAYMSPEQARGQTVDKRTDVWAFGCVLFEMLTGRRAFAGDTVTETLAELLKGEPPWEALPASTPATTRALLRRCLEKDPRRRLRDIGDARLLMEAASAGAVSSSGEARPAEPSGEEKAAAARARRRRLLMTVAAAGILLAGGLALGAWLTRGAGPRPTRPQARFVMSVKPSEPAYLLDLADTTHVAISPDGSRVAYIAGPPSMVYVRSIDDVRGRYFENTMPALCPFFSPDGQWIGFTQRDELRKVSVVGGAVETVCKLPSAAAPRGATWSQDGSIVFALEGSGLFRVAASGGKPEALTTPDATGRQMVHSWPHFLPDGKSLLFEIRNRDQSGPGDLAVLDLESGKWRSLSIRGSSPQYLRSGHLVFTSGSTLMAAPFQLGSNEVAGDPIAMTEGVTAFERSGASEFAIAADGSLAGIWGEVVGETARSVPVWVDRSGNVQSIPGLPVDTYTCVRVSPDGKTLALDRGKGDIWTYDVARATLTRLTTDSANDSQPVWTPDSRKIVFRSNRGGEIAALYWQNADGSGSAERLASFTPPVEVVLPEGFTPDGAKLLLTRLMNSNMGTAMISIGGDGKLEPLVDTDVWEGVPQVSPDGHWIAYHAMARAVNQFDVFVERFPELGERRQVSVERASVPQWSADGRELFFLGAGGHQVMAVAVKSEPRFEVEAPRVLFEGSFIGSWGPLRPYSVAPDGRFLMLRADKSMAAGLDPIVIYAQNWADEVARKLAAR